MNAALDRLFRPLARLAISKGLGFAHVAARLKRAYVDAAGDIAGPDAPVSRISVLTGLQRRDITRLRSEAEPPLPPRLDAPAKIVARWQAQHQGTPLPQHGPAPSFDALARSVRQDVHPKSFLEALITAGTVAVEDGTVRLMRPAHVPLQGSEDQIDYLGKNVGDHLAVAVDNVLGPDKAFELAVHYNRLTPEAAQEVEALWRRRMGEVLHEVNARAAALQDQGEGHTRIRGGGYFRTEIEE